MTPLPARISSSLGLLLCLLACGDRKSAVSDSAGLAAADESYPRPVNATNWALDAGPFVIVPLGDGDSVGIVLPQATDSTMPTEESEALRSPLSVDLIGRSGEIVSGAVVTPLSRTVAAAECRSWPAGRLRSPRSGWRVGFTAGHVAAVPLDSIESMSSADSASLATAITQSVASLPVANDRDFRGLPFRVRSAHTFRTDSISGVIADVVRIVNEEANPRLEHLFVVAEQQAQSKYRVGFFSRTAGAEDEAEITELLAVILIGPAKRPAIIVNVEYDEGGNLGMLERTAPGQWRFKWRSAYTGC